MTYIHSYMYMYMYVCIKIFNTWKSRGNLVEILWKSRGNLEETWVIRTIDLKFVVMYSVIIVGY